MIGAMGLCGLGMDAVWMRGWSGWWETVFFVAGLVCGLVALRLVTRGLSASASEPEAQPTPSGPLGRTED